MTNQATETQLYPVMYGDNQKLAIARTKVYLHRVSVLHAPPDKPFVLKSGKTSTTYLDVRRMATRNDGLNALASAFCMLLRCMGLQITARDKVAGVPVGAVPLSTALGLTLWVNMLIVRHDAKDHGTGKLIEGQFDSQDGVIVVEDVLTTGSSTLRTLDILREAGLNIKAILAVVDREQGAVELLRQHAPVGVITTMSELLSITHDDNGVYTIPDKTDGGTTAHVQDYNLLQAVRI